MLTIIDDGFQLSFSFLKSDEIPKIVSGSRGYRYFDCSQAGYEVYAHHVRCNKFVECLDGEDEVACAYDSLHCPPGYFRTHDK